MAQSTRRSALSPASSAFAVAGSLMVLIGAQMPALELKLLGELSYLDIGGAPGTVLVAAAIGALIAVLIQSRGGLRLCAVALWIALLWPALRGWYEQLVPPQRGALDELGDALGRAVGGALGDNLFQITGLRAGAFVLLGGCVLVTAGAFCRARR